MPLYWDATLATADRRNQRNNPKHHILQYYLFKSFFQECCDSIFKYGEILISNLLREYIGFSGCIVFIGCMDLSNQLFPFWGNGKIFGRYLSFVENALFKK